MDKQKTCRSSNRCFRGNTHLAGAPAVHRGPARRSIEVEAGATWTSPRKSRLHAQSEKLVTFREMHAWALAGFKKDKSPIQSLCIRYGYDRNYPRRIWNTVFVHGSIDNQWQ